MGLLFLSVLSSKALVLPLQLNLGGGKTPSLRSIATCPGHEDDVMVVVEGTTDEEICMPGTSTINVHTRVKEDLPIDLKIKMDLKKIAPFPMTVPCLDGVGSCEYDICSYIENMSDILCPAFPAYQPCSCPLLAGEPILGAVMEGDYEATATLYGASDKDRILGCMKLT